MEAHITELIDKQMRDKLKEVIKLSESYGNFYDKRFQFRQEIGEGESQNAVRLNIYPLQMAVVLEEWDMAEKLHEKGYELFHEYVGENAYEHISDSFKVVEYLSESTANTLYCLMIAVRIATEGKAGKEWLVREVQDYIKNDKVQYRLVRSMLSDMLAKYVHSDSENIAARNNIRELFPEFYNELRG